MKIDMDAFNNVLELEKTQNENKKKKFINKYKIQMGKVKKNILLYMYKYLILH